MEHSTFTPVGESAAAVVSAARAAMDANMRRDWIAHAMGCRRRACEYRRWALEYPADHPKRGRYLAEARNQIQKAREAIKQARKLS